jgi:hypothetical protein
VTVTELARKRAQACAVCNGWVLSAGDRWVRTRQTKGMVCERCGWDYGRDGEP